MAGMEVNEYARWDYFRDSRNYFLEAFIQQQIYELEAVLKEWDVSGKPPHNLRDILENYLKTLKNFDLQDREKSTCPGDTWPSKYTWTC